MSEKGDRKRVLGKSIRKQYRTQKRNITLSVLCAILTYAFISCVALTEIMPQTYSITVGESADEDIVSIADVEDVQQTQLKREEARNTVADIYVPDKNKTNETIEYFEETIFKGFLTVSTYGNNVRGGRENTDGYVVQYDTEKKEAFRQNELSFLRDSTDTANGNLVKIDDKVVALLNSNPNDIRIIQDWFITELKTLLNIGIG